jgi:hypothetical protein
VKITGERQIEEGKAAEQLLKYAGPMLLEREEQIVLGMLQWFRTIKDTPAADNPQVGMRFIAQLSEVRAMMEEARYRVEKGADAMAKIVNNSEAARH